MNRIRSWRGTVAAFLFLILGAACRSYSARAFEEDFQSLREVSNRSQGLPSDPRELEAWREKYHRALARALDRSAKRPDDADWAWRTGELERIGFLLGAQGAAEQAEHHLRIALAAKPSERRAHISLGFLYLATSTDDAPNAEREFRQAIDGTPSDGTSSDRASSVPPEAYKGLFLSYYYQGRWADALTAADAYLTGHPADEDFRKLRAMAASNATRGREVKVSED